MNGSERDAILIKMATSLGKIEGKIDCLPDMKEDISTVKGDLAEVKTDVKVHINNKQIHRSGIPATLWGIFLKIIGGK